MDWLERMNLTMSYIEDRLDAEVDYGEIARIVCCPPGLFQRVFAVLTDVPLSEYIRRRRLTKAAFDLKTTEERVIDIAVKYGYDSADAFSVAFKRQHGITPAAARDSSVTLKAYPRMTFSLSLKGDVEMNCRIEQKPAFLVAGRTSVFSNASGWQNNTIDKFWMECGSDGTLERFSKLAATPVTNGNLIGVCYDGQSDGTFHYMICAEVAEAPAELDSLNIPASTWAVFECVGPMPGAIQAMWKRIMGEFLPGSSYQHAGTPDFELYYPGENDENYRSEIWIPVVKKQ